MRAILAALVLIAAAPPELAADPRTLTLEEMDARERRLPPPSSRQGCFAGYIEDMSRGVCVPESPALAPDLGADWTWQAVGVARVIDGDTIELKHPKLAFCPPPAPCPKEAFNTVRRVEIQLYGIDALEPDQICHGPDGAPWACGVAAGRYLEALIALDRVRCFESDPRTDNADLYGQATAICHVWGRSNLNADMVRFGYALADNQYPDAYALDQRIAERNRAGMWSGAFVEPWEWRRRKTLEKLRRRIDRAMETIERDRI